MICKECGAIVKNNEEYCRKCGSLVINFNNKENPVLKDICIKNNLSRKFKSLINLFSNNDKKYHNVSNINKNKKVNSINLISNTKNTLNKNNLSNKFKDISNKIDNYIKDEI